MKFIKLKKEQEKSENEENDKEEEEKQGNLNQSEKGNKVMKSYHNLFCKEFKSILRILENLIISFIDLRSYNLVPNKGSVHSIKNSKFKVSDSLERSKIDVMSGMVSYKIISSTLP